MQLTCFSRPFAPCRGPFLWRDAMRSGERGWALLCLLPMLMMSLMSQAPHQHELRDFALALHAASPNQSAFSDSVRPGVFISNRQAATSQRGAAVPAFAMSVAPIQEALQNICLLCQWSSVTGALLAIALALLLLQLSVLVRSATASFFSFSFPLALRSRAPPR